jgi:hypothetical protein
MWFEIGCQAKIRPGFLPFLNASFVLRSWGSGALSVIHVVKRGGIVMLCKRDILRPLAFLGFVLFTLTFAVGCRGDKMKEHGGAAAASPSDEVSIFVLIDPNKANSLVVVPDSAYLVVKKQKAHWIALQGDLTDIDFNVKKGAGAGAQTQAAMEPHGRPEKPNCMKMQCTMGNPPTEKGTFPYTITLQLNGTTYRADPQLVVGD